MTLLMRDKEQQRFGELKKSVTFIRRGRNVIDEDIAEEVINNNR